MRSGDFPRPRSDPYEWAAKYTKRNHTARHLALSDMRYLEDPLEAPVGLALNVPMGFYAQFPMANHALVVFFMTTRIFRAWDQCRLSLYTIYETGATSGAKSTNSAFPIWEDEPGELIPPMGRWKCRHWRDALGARKGR